jgi:hypothetical protein
MRRSKKFIILTVLGAVVLVGSITGVVLAQTGNTNDSQAKAGPEALLAKVCEIYQQNTGVTIDSQELQKAFDQAQSDMRTEALKNRLQSLVDGGKITQDQADQYLKWWQSKPDVPAEFGFRGDAGLPGMGGPHGWGGLCAPQPPEQASE